ncbi:MAG: hypothetical protein WAK29_11370 [Terriglobales bacterium]
MTSIYILVAALVTAGWAAAYIGSRRAQRRTIADLRREFQGQIDSLTAQVIALERTSRPETAPAPAKAQTTTEQVTPETLRAITETVSALLGKKVRVLSVKTLPTPEAAVSSWAQQGRVVVQASHNFAQRGHEL